MGPKKKRRYLPLAQLEELRALARYYKDILASLSHVSGKHLLDLRQVVKHGLTADFGLFLDRASVVLDEAEFDISVERVSPSVATTLVEQSDLSEEVSSAAPNPNLGQDATKTIEILDRERSSARLVAIFRKQEQDPFNRETIVGYPIASGKYGNLSFCAPLLYYPVSVTYDPVHSRCKIRKLTDAPILNSNLIAKLASSDEEAAFIRNRLLEYFHQPDFDNKTLDKVVRVLGEVVPGFKGLERDGKKLNSLGASLEARGTKTPTVFNSVVIVNSPRTSAFLQDDLEELAKLKTLVEETAINPLLEPVPDHIDDDSKGKDSKEEEPLLFPLVSNEAQRRVARRSERGKVLVVQGPPGTGKSHTIANLV